MKRFTLWVAFAVCFLTVSANGQTYKDHFKVWVDVKGTDSAKAEALSFISRELRSLKDVDIVESNPEYAIRLTVHTVKMTNGYEGGYAYSIVISEPFNIGLFDAALEMKWVNQDAANVFTDICARQEELIFHALWISGMDGLRKTCEEPVAGFDSQPLEKRRKARRQVQERRAESEAKQS